MNKPLRDPGDLSYDDLVELVRTLQMTLWPADDADQEWTADTIDSVVGAMRDAGLGPAEE
jgi:hypothetical protein